MNNIDMNIEVADTQENAVINNKTNNIIYNFLKRTIDIVGSLCGLILLSPLLIVIGLLIKFDSKGPYICSKKGWTKG